MFKFFLVTVCAILFTRTNSFRSVHWKILLHDVPDERRGCYIFVPFDKNQKTAFFGTWRNEQTLNIRSQFLVLKTLAYKIKKKFMHEKIKKKKNLCKTFKYPFCTWIMISTNYSDKILVYFLSASVYNTVILKNDILTIKTVSNIKTHLLNVQKVHVNNNHIHQHLWKYLRNRVM